MGRLLNMRIYKTSFISLMIVLALGFVVAAIGLFGFLPRAQADGPAGSRLITIYDRGGDRSVITQKSTLREAFAEIGLVLDEHDIVEPGLDEQLVGNDYQVNIYRARPVVIVDGARVVKVMSAYQTPQQITEHAGISLRSEDEAKLELTDNIMSDGASERLVIDRAMPLQLNLYGRTETVYTQATTVTEFLEEKNITLGAKDDMSVGEDATLSANMKLRIWRNGKQTMTQEEAINFSTEEVQDANREVGYRQVKTPGKKGKKMVTYEIVMQNGKEVSRKMIQTVVVTKPAKQVDVVGTKHPPVAGPAEILAKINQASARLGIDANRVAGIAKCESGFNPMADSGYYKGLFQHDPRYWPSRAASFGFAGASIFDVDAQIGVSTGMMAGGGWSHWGCDTGH